MTKLLSLLLAISVSILNSCSDSHTHQDVVDGTSEGYTHQDFLNRTAPQAEELARSNIKHQLWSFVRGSWEGGCHPDADARSIVTFADDGRVQFRSIVEKAEFDAMEHGLYEIVGEKKIKLYYTSAGDFVTIKKINDNMVEFEGLDVPIYARCEFSRSRLKNVF